MLFILFVNEFIHPFLHAFYYKNVKFHPIHKIFYKSIALQRQFFGRRREEGWREENGNCPGTMLKLTNAFDKGVVASGWIAYLIPVFRVYITIRKAIVVYFARISLKCIKLDMK